MRKRVLKIVGIVVVVIGLVVGGLYAFHAYKISQVEQRLKRFADWQVRCVFPTNPVALVEARGAPPTWWGSTNLDVYLVTDTGRRFTINCVVESSPFETKITHFYIFMLNPAFSDLSKLTTEQLAEVAQGRRGKTVNLPIELLDSDEPVDLRTLLPEAFKESAQKKQ